MTSPVAHDPIADRGCRLCGAPLHHAFRSRLLDRHEVDYFECSDCGSLQTEPPHWLAEAYSDGNLAATDTGAAQRNLLNLAAAFLVVKSSTNGVVVDFGGGDGLLCRLLRDRDVDCWVEDAYAAPSYAPLHVAPAEASPDCVLAFEVLEHMANPRVELESVLGRGADVVLASTARWSKQGPDWWYLSPETGQHVFFYTQDALEFAGAQHGYTVRFAGDYVLFARSWTRRLRVVSRLIRSTRLLRPLAALVLAAPVPGIAKDHESALRRERSDRVERGSA